MSGIREIPQERGKVEPSLGVDAVADLGPIPQIDSFALKLIGEGNICLEGSSRFVHERDVTKLLEWAHAAEARIRSAITPAREAAMGVVSAWESLPGGRNYPTHVIADWLKGPMKDALDNLRAALAKPTPPPPVGSGRKLADANSKSPIQAREE